MFCNYPVSIPFYVIALPLLLFVFAPRLLEPLVKSRIVWLVGAAVFVAGMLLLPSRNHLMGDGLQRLADSGKNFMYTEALDVLAHRLVSLVVGSTLWSYRIIGFVAGLFYLNGIRLLMRLGSDSVEKTIIALAFLCSATIQFYFGYVESYGLLNLFILYYIYFSWKCVQQERLTAAPAIFFALATLSHLSGAALFPSLVYLYKGKYPRIARHGLPLIILAAASVFFVGRFWRTLVTLFPNDYSTYSLFSLAHVTDLFCILLLVSPAFILALIGRRWSRSTTFMAIALAGTMLFTTLIDPVLGAVRDWDLLSIFALPLAGMIALRAPRHAITVVILAVAIVVRIVPWLLFNSQPQVEFMRSMLADDIHYTEHFAKGERLDSWGLLLYRIGDRQGAEEAWKRRLRYSPNQLNTLSMLAPLQFKLGKFPESFQSYLRMLQIEPDNPETRYHAIYVLFRMGDYEDARRMLTSSAPEFQNNPNSQLLFAGILGGGGQHMDAVAIVESIPEVGAEPYLPYMLARSCLEVGRTDLARRLIDRALELDSTNVQYRKLADRIPPR